MNYQEMHYKEITPEITVSKLKNKLKEMNIEVEEIWMDESYVGTYSLRVTFKGTDIGANGKGVSKEYAEASAYAELFERYQNDLLSNAYVNTRERGRHDFYLCADEKIMSAEEIVQQKDPFINNYMKSRNLKDKGIQKQVNAFKKINRIDYFITNKENSYICVPFYDIKSKKVYYLPKSIYLKFYGSNGMAAGNTTEEALVQGLSEIYERVAQQRIFIEKPCLPDVPDEYIKKFPYVYEMYTKLKECDKLIVRMKDCSFGGKYPVAALIIISKDTGKFGIKLGCHPDYGIAMERTFTEAAQGNDILDYVDRSELDFFNSFVDDVVNIENCYKVGLAKYPYQLFSDKYDNEFTPCMDVALMDNTQILKHWIKSIIDEGHDVLIRDVSNLGFPSFHILIPGMSEVKRKDDVALRAANIRAFSTSLIMKPENINIENVQYIQAILEYQRNRVMENSISAFYPADGDYNIPFEKYGVGNDYYIAMCDIMQKKYDSALDRIKAVQHDIKEIDVAKEDRIYLKALETYLAGMVNLDNHEEVMKYINLFYNRTIYDKINDYFIDINKIFVKQYRNINYYKEKGLAKEIDVLYHIITKLRDEQVKNPISQENFLYTLNI